MASTIYYLLVFNNLIRYRLSGIYVMYIYVMSNHYNKSMFIFVILKKNMNDLLITAKNTKILND